jgi:hypothetical protein
MQANQSPLQLLEQTEPELILKWVKSPQWLLFTPKNRVHHYSTLDMTIMTSYQNASSSCYTSPFMANDCEDLLEQFNLSND